MSNEQRPNYKDLEPTYKITGQDQDYTYIQKETRYTYGTNPNLNSHNLISLGLMFNAMCPKKYRNIDAAAIFLDKIMKWLFINAGLMMRELENHLLFPYISQH